MKMRADSPPFFGDVSDYLNVLLMCNNQIAIRIATQFLLLPYAYIPKIYRKDKYDKPECGSHSDIDMCYGQQTATIVHIYAC